MTNSPFDFDSAKTALEVELRSRIKNAERKLTALLFSLVHCLKWPDMYHEGQLLQANMYQWKEGAKQLSVLDWENENQIREFVFTKPLSREKEISERFKISKRQRQAISKVESEIAKAKEREDALLSQMESLNSIQNMEDLLAYRKQFFSVSTKEKSEVQKTLKALPYREFWSSSGLRIWVGKRGKNNETLTFTLANGLDFWLHVDGYPGSHVIIKGTQGKDPDAQSIQEAAQLAIYYSKAKDQGRADVVVTQRKYVSRFGKGSQNCGKVQISKSNLISVKPDPQSLEKLKYNQKKG
ncbi:MAG: DUF814 domain-containing protein [Parachlamydiaceae bacterium]|nr:DUF814 domain-containing protein [Parachlamydiaceae bacterium]